MSSKKTLQPIEFHKCPTIAFQLIIHVPRKKKIGKLMRSDTKEGIKIVPKFHFL